jgi:trimethylamine--corrinoid protein Co-methyltransferase
LANFKIQALTESECARVHELTLEILSKTGVRVDTPRGRQVLRQAGADVDETSCLVHFPHRLVEEALRLAPRQFSLGGRRPGWRLEMNNGECTLLADGGAMSMVEAATGERRPATEQDWLRATQLIDALDEVGIYWWMVQEPNPSTNMGDIVAYWRSVFTHFTKHVQDSTENKQQTRWMLEVLQVIFGGQSEVQRLCPLSFLLCPLSPLAIESAYTDAYLETIGWGIPVAIMPMPLMGTTAPGRLIATTLQGNCEVLAMLCMIQAAAPGTPVIYAPALSLIEPRTGRFTGGAVEHALLSVASVEMARFYGLPVEASTGGSDSHVPGIQTAYERAINWTLPTLCWPDILVGPGLLDGSTVFSYEQLIVDVEVFRRCRRLKHGISTLSEDWLVPEIARVGPGGNYLARRSTRDALRDQEWYISQLGDHDSYERWLADGKVDVLAQARDQADLLLAKRVAMPLDGAARRELELIEQCARNEPPVA